MSKEQIENWGSQNAPEAKKRKEEIYICGFFLKETVFLFPNDFSNRMSNYFHECGHIIGKSISFTDGSVLKPDEVKKTEIPITQKDRLKILKHAVSEKRALMDPFEESLAKRILGTFTKGNYDLEKINLINLSYEQYQKIIKHWAIKYPDNPTHKVKDNGKIFAKKTKKGTLLEVPAYAVSKACMTILENSTAIGNLNFSYEQNGQKGSHATAFNIVEEAYTQKEKVLPSYLDISKMSHKLKYFKKSGLIKK
jgi:hypothetical protein